MFHETKDLGPAFHEMISDEDEDANPKRGAAISVHRERMVLELGSACDNGGEVADTGNEIAHHERPMPDAIEPVVDALNISVLNMQPASHARMEEFPTDGATDEVAAGDARHASGQRAGNRGDQSQMALVYEEAAAGEQELVGDGKSDDAEDQERKDGEVTVGGNPLEDGVFQ